MSQPPPIGLERTVSVQTFIEVILPDSSRFQIYLSGHETLDGNVYMFFNYNTRLHHLTFTLCVL